MIRKPTRHEVGVGILILLRQDIKDDLNNQVHPATRKHLTLYPKKQSLNDQSHQLPAYGIRRVGCA